MSSGQVVLGSYSAQRVVVRQVFACTWELDEFSPGSSGFLLTSAQHSVSRSQDVGAASVFAVFSDLPQSLMGMQQCP